MAAHPEVFRRMLDNPDRARAEFSLLDFTKQAWEQLEPGIPFVSGWAVGAIAEHLQAVTEGQVKRLLINVPPGCTKSMLTNVMWPAWEWGPRGLAQHRWISASYEQGLATRDLVRCRDLLLSEWYQGYWPLALKSDQNEKTYYENNRTGWRKSASVRAALTGYRGDRIVVDDPHSVRGAESEAEREESLRWFTETLPTRLNKIDDSAIVVIMQRVHERDISGLILDQLADDYTHLMLPMEYEQDRHCRTTVVADVHGTGEWQQFEDPRSDDGELLWPERFSAEGVAKLKRAMQSHGGSYAEAAQLQQRPAPRGGGMFKRAAFRIVDSIPEGAHVVARARGWDFAATSKNVNANAAYTAGVKLAKLSTGQVLVEDVVRGQLGPHAVKQLLLATARQDGHTVRQSIPQDPGQAGKAQVADMIALLEGFPAFASPESGSKEFRALPLAAQSEAGNVLLIRAPWNDPFLAEAELFPAGHYKDQIDAASRAYHDLLKMRDDQVSIEPGALFLGR